MEDVLSECSDICEEYSSRDDDDVIDYDDNINDPDYFLPSERLDHNNNNGQWMSNLFSDDEEEEEEEEDEFCNQSYGFKVITIIQRDVLILVV